MMDFSSPGKDEGQGMKRHVVSLDEVERNELAGITSKDSHRSGKVINALNLCK